MSVGGGYGQGNPTPARATARQRADIEQWSFDVAVIAYPSSRNPVSRNLNQSSHTTFDRNGPGLKVPARLHGGGDQILD